MARPDSAFAVETLEFGVVRDLLARHTSFSASRALAQTLTPTGELHEARRRQATTVEALKLPGLRPALHLGGVHDVRPLAERAQVGGVLSAGELLDVASTVKGARAWRHGLAPLLDETPALLEIAESHLSDHPGLVEDIQDAISENAEILDSASPALARIRSELRGAHDRLVTRLREIMSAAPFRDVVQDPVVTQRNGRYVIPIRAESRGQVPGIVHDQSASGATLFVEPLAVVEMANRWRSLIVEEEREIERILRALSQEVGQQAEELASSVEGLAQIDLARAAAALAEQQHATAPELLELPRPAGQAILTLRNARHPLLPGAAATAASAQTSAPGRQEGTSAQRSASALGPRDAASAQHSSSAASHQQAASTQASASAAGGQEGALAQRSISAPGPQESASPQQGSSAASRQQAASTQASASAAGGQEGALAQRSISVAGRQEGTSAQRSSGVPGQSEAASAQPRGVVPISLELGADFDVLLITGPNTGGKTVALKTAGLLTLMAQAGLLIPADEGSRVAVFERVQADIGDEQSLQQSLSTFSSHISRIVRMLRDADSCSLILLDELGAGTDPQEGAAIARALLDFLRERGAYVVATTHYPELKSYAEATPRVQNASVEFDLQTLSPTYRLMVGTPGRSNALLIAERLGMPPEVLQAARTYVSPQTQEAEAMLEQIARERGIAEDARARALKEAAEAATLKIRARGLLRDAELKHREVWEHAQTAADQELAELRREAHRARQQLQAARSAGVSSTARAAIDAALELPRRLQVPPAPVAPAEVEEAPAEAAPVAVGAEVMVPRLGLPGRVMAVRDETVEVEVLGRRVRMPLRELEGATRPTSAQKRDAQPERLAPVAVASPRGEVPYQLDLRGLRRDEALERVEQYLEDASLVGMPEARIVHGKGTGAIRQAVRETLRRNQFVARYQPETDASGGDGATQVWFK